MDNNYMLINAADKNQWERYSTNNAIYFGCLTSWEVFIHLHKHMLISLALIKRVWMVVAGRNSWWVCVWSVEVGDCPTPITAMFLIPPWFNVNSSLSAGNFTNSLSPSTRPWWKSSSTFHHLMTVNLNTSCSMLLDILNRVGALRTNWHQVQTTNGVTPVE